MSMFTELCQTKHNASYIINACAIFLLGAIVSYIDVDFFQAQLNPFTKILGSTSESTIQAFKYACTIIIFVSGSVCLLIRSYSLNYWIFLSTTLLICSYAGIISVLAGGGITSFFLGEVRQLLLIPLVMPIYVVARDSDLLKPFALGFFLVNAFKCLYWITRYLLGFRLSVLGVETMVWDYTFLLIQVPCILLAVCAAKTSKNRHHQMLYFLSSFLSVIVIVGSFRRLAIISLATITFTTIFVNGWQQKRLIKTAFLLTALGLVSIVGVGLLYYAMFGADVVRARVQSIFMATDVGEYNTSNKMYADDWIVATELFLEYLPFGIGFGRDYPIYRVTHDIRGDTEMYIPLHVGLLDYWVRIGVAFGIIHLWILWVILKCILKRNAVSFSNWSVTCASTICLWMVMLPLAPAFILDIKQVMLFAGLFSMIWFRETGGEK